MTEKTFYIAWDDQRNPVIYWLEDKDTVNRCEAKRDLARQEHWSYELKCNTSAIVRILGGMEDGTLKVIKWPESDFPTVAQVRELLEVE